MFIALAIDALVGWPDWVFRRIGHPVSWIGRIISWADRNWNGKKSSRMAGVATVILVVGVAAGVAWAVAWVLPSGGWLAVVLTGILAWPFVAAKSLHDHVLAVAVPLADGDPDGARKAVSMIVGRNPDTLDEAAMGRAALESLAENASDGVVAPLFWGVLLGLPGTVAYKAINTMDSMIGHRTPRYENFGWAAARLDDVANYIPARLTGVAIAVVSKARGTAWRSMLRDAGQHRSPNAGWPEAAMAGALGVRLSGPRVYGDRATEDPWLNPVAGDPRPEDLFLALRLFRRAVLVVAVVLLGLAAL
ncbi:MAG: cobalamin biosynthesis protein CobD [Silicimonas sp.]|nr:cobalamin biosynthesis protein CobD [Silicimonas sp.]